MLPTRPPGGIRNTMMYIKRHKARDLDLTFVVEVIDQWLKLWSLMAKQERTETKLKHRNDRIKHKDIRKVN